MCLPGKVLVVHMPEERVRSVQILSSDALSSAPEVVECSAHFDERSLDRELVAGVRMDQDQAWLVLTKRYTALIWSIASGYRLGTDDCADVTQNTWFRLLHSLDELREPDSVKGFLATCARYESVNVIRHRERARPTGLSALSADSPSGELTPEELATSDDQTLRAAFTRLSARCRTVLLMLNSDPPASYEAVAEHCHISVNSVGPDRRRCLDKLREHYGTHERREVVLEVSAR